MQKANLLLLIFLAAACPISADAEARQHITCDMVRAYVAQVGLEQARAIATAQGMTASQVRSARSCLEQVLNAR